MNPQITIASLTQQVIGLLIRHGLTSFGALMVQWGLLDKSTADQLITIVVGVVIAGLGLVWSYAEKRLNLVNLINAATGLPTAVVTTGGNVLAAAPVVTEATTITVPASPK